MAAQEYMVNVDVLSLYGIRFSSASADPQALPSPYVRITVFGETRYTDTQYSQSNATLNSFFSWQGPLDEEM